MDELEFHLNRLIEYISPASPLRIDLGMIRILEHQDWLGRIPREIPKSQLFVPSEYSAKFSKLLQRGFHWVNLRALGFMNNSLIVIIGLPAYQSEIKGKTSVNLSGPPSNPQGDPQWDASGRIEIIEDERKT